MSQDSGSPASAPIPVLAIIVNYRSARLSLRAVASLEQERAAHPELDLRAVVVENASGDADVLREGMAQYAAFARLIVSETNGGFGAGNNIGLRSASEGTKPRYVYFLNPDTEVRPGGVAELVRFLEAHPRAGIAGGSFEHIDGTPWSIAFRFPSPLGELEGGAETGVLTKLLRRFTVPRDMGDAAEPVDWVSGASMLFRMDTLEATGGFDETFFLYYEEIDLCLRAQRLGWECWYVPQSRVMHIRGQSTGVTALDDKPKRLPKYWFESRRRYFAKNDGYAYAVAADLAFLVGSSLGSLKRRLKGQANTPHLLRDFVSESVLFGRNRHLAPARYYQSEAERSRP
jgi:N-acetylglucosaminyl-diphospho-decaprenol L-rhamnosyltransferase